MARTEDATLATIDDGLAALTEIFPAVAFIIARQRINLTKRDVAELERIVDAAGRAKTALMAARRERQETR